MKAAGLNIIKNARACACKGGAQKTAFQQVCPPFQAQSMQAHCLKKSPSNVTFHYSLLPGLQLDK